MVEFALVLPILLLLLCGIIDFGWLYYNQITLNNAAREGARYAVIHCGASSDWQDKAIQEVSDSMVGVPATEIDILYTREKNQITARVTADPRILTALTSTLLGKTTLTLHAECTMRVEN